VASSTDGGSSATQSTTLGDTDPFASAGGSTGDPVPDTDTASCALEQLVFVATLAECTDPQNNDPGLCESIAGEGHFMVDSSSGQLDMLPLISFLIFQLDGVTNPQSAWLELTVSGTSSSESTGELWQVTDFDYDDLLVQQPVQTGTGPLATDQGAVGSSERVEFPLPLEAVDGAQTLYLGLFPKSSDGLRYENHPGDPSTRPRLLVERCQ
jgi:hypothetical protein